MPGKIAYDRKSLLIDWERKFIFSGTLHYFRHPSPEQWKHRINRLKELGFNALDTYFSWAYHSPAEGKYDFTGSRDIDLFMRMVEDAGMYLIARPGPYICAEVDGGGFPGWLLSKRGTNFRCRRNGKPLYDAEYMKHCGHWFKEVVPRIAKFKNLVLFQVENEYNFFPTPRGWVAKLQGAIQQRFGQDVMMRLLSSGLFYKIQIYLQRRAFNRPGYRRENQYLKELYQLARNLGITAPIFHNDVGGASMRFVDVDIPAIDEYPITNFVSDWEHGNPFARADIFEQALDALKMDCPLLGGEIQGGWYDLWGGRGYEHNGDHLGPLAMDMTLKSCLAQGMSILNIYMGCGGTSWGYTSSPDVYSSYTYGAPITEGGRVSGRGRACKAFSDFVFRNEKSLLESELLQEYRAGNGELFARVRRSPDGEHFIFLRNLTGREQSVKLEIGEFKAPCPAMEILLLDKDGAEIDRLPSMSKAQAEPMVILEKKPELREWDFYIYDEPLKPESQEGWEKIGRERTDIDSLGFHYGFVWYRAKYQGRINSVKIDARHLWALYLNGRLLRAFDNFPNKLGVGDDLPSLEPVSLPADLQADDNALVLLVQSLGHNKGFMEDSHNRRGLIRFEPEPATDMQWEARGGLLPGETGITPQVDFSKFLSGGARIKLPHKQPLNAGLGIYLTEFDLNIPAPDRPAIGVKLEKCSGFANLYVNGWLIGRYWDALGPQKLFYLPPGLTNINGRNQLAIAVWPWGQEIELGTIKIEEYP
jgi:hypothetical protein